MPNSFTGQGIKQGKEKRKYTFKYIKLQTKMDFKRVYSPEDRENKCKIILLYSYAECIDHDRKKTPHSIMEYKPK